MSKSGQSLFAEKVGMTQLFLEDGLRVPVTVLLVGDNVITQKRTVENDGYSAIQIGAGAIREKLINRPAAGHFKKANVEPKRHLKEVRLTPEEAQKHNVGDVLGIDLFKDLKAIDVSGVSKGRGTAGVMKRHNMSGFRATHGTHEYFRHGGSIGCRATPGKVHKGKRMAGRMGNERVTVLNLAVVRVDADKKLLFVRGAVPGPDGALVEIYPSRRVAQKGRRMQAEQQVASKNPMKASKAGTGGAKGGKK
jgi:large subunit ribosomal protein L3